jgi:non-specific serine/threonine protein kinase/serine/threonine-protein kinase
MTPETWAKITDLFGRVLDHPTTERAAFLAALREADPAAAAELESLLTAHHREGEFLPDLPAAAAPMPDLAGRTVGAYRLIRLLGSGGMGAVYLGERSDGAYSKHVAVKLLSAALVQSRDRFQREREFLARLDHPNITQLFDAGATSDGLHYLVMEYVEGVPIDRYCADRDLAINARVGLLIQVCAGVAHAHQNLIVHCDIKPANILVTAEGTVKLLDFGIAKLLDPAAGMTLLRPATPAYSSPEQLQGDPPTTASDVYAIGMLGYVVLTGGGPYQSRSGRLDEMVRAILTAEPQRASQVAGLSPQRARKLRGDLDNVLAKAIAREPHRRYASVQQLADDFDAYLDGFPVRARADSVFYRLRKTIGRHRFASTAAALSVVSLVAAAGVSTWQARKAQQRLNELREFAHAVVFDVNDALSPIPGTTAARKLVVETALRYLDRVAEDRGSDAALREELAAAYIRIGRVQGGAFLPNLGDTSGAVESFRKALAAIGESGGQPSLERLRIEAHINIGLLAVDPIQGAPAFHAAIEAADRLLSADADDVSSLRLVADAYHGEATIAHLTNRAPEHVTMSAREVEMRQRIVARAPNSWRDAAALARAIAQHALALEQRNDVTQSAADLERARAILEAAIARHPGNQILTRGLAEVRSRMVTPLLALGRTADASRQVEVAIGMLQPLVASDPNNIQYKADLAYAWHRLGDGRRAAGRLGDALELYRKALAVRRDRAARDAGFVFVPWELTRSLNTVAEVLLAMSPPRAEEANNLFEEAIRVGAHALALAPSHNQLRKQVAIADQGIAQALLLRRRPAGEARAFLERSAETWRAVLESSDGDLKDADRPGQVLHQLESLRSEP